MLHLEILEGQYLIRVDLPVKSGNSICKIDEIFATLSHV